MTSLLPATDAGIAEAADMLRGGLLVAFGTETVYGLGGRADRAETVARIYAAKQRPLHNPLICHYPQTSDTVADAELGPLAQSLAEAFWPGPLTLVLPRRDKARVAAGVAPAGTLAIRVPGPDTTRRLLTLVGVPVAAPSANRAGRISPTTAAHVLEGLDGRIDAVLDLGPCAVGLESTVIDLTRGAPRLLRPGGIEPARITALIGPLTEPGTDSGPLRAPGQLASHYAPVAPLRLEATRCDPAEALLAFGAVPGSPGAVYQLSAAGDLNQAASRLFDGLRWLDTAVAARGLRGIAAMSIPNQGIGEAINDRLRRAAQPRA